MNWVNKLLNFWSDVFKGNDVLKSVLGPVGSNLLSSAAGTYLGTNATGRDREMMQFNSEEAAKEREWQEHMRATQYQTQVQDMSSAGLNPAMMYGGTTSSSTPSSPSASSGAPSQSQLLDLFASVLSAQKVKSEIGLNNSLANLYSSQAEGQSTDNLYKDQFWSSFLNKTDAEINKLISSSGLDLSETARNDILNAFDSARTIRQNLDNEQFQQLMPLTIQAQDLLNQLTQANIHQANERVNEIRQNINESLQRIGLIIAQTKSEGERALALHQQAIFYASSDYKNYADASNAEQQSDYYHNLAVKVEHDQDLTDAQRKEIDERVAVYYGQDWLKKTMQMNVVTGYWNSVNGSLNAGANVASAISRFTPVGAISNATSPLTTGQVLQHNFQQNSQFARSNPVDFARNVVQREGRWLPSKFKGKSYADLAVDPSFIQHVFMTYGITM